MRHKKLDVAAKPLYFTAGLEINAFLMYPTLMAHSVRPVKIVQKIKCQRNQYCHHPAAVSAEDAAGYSVPV